MSTTVGLAGVFFGGALPWLEAVVVVPAGVVAGLPLVPVIVVGAIGNLITVALAAFAGEWIKARWSTWRARRQGSAASDPRKEERSARRRERIQRMMDRGGLPLLALVGPIGLGTQASAIIAVASGSSALRSFTWIAIGTVGWCIAAGVAASQGVQFLGMGT